MKLQILVSAVNADVSQLVRTMRLRAESIIVDQDGENRYEEFEYEGHRMRCYHFAERGVGLSRNTALMRADGEISLFADEDIVYEDGAPERICAAFLAHPEADVLLFNVRVEEKRRTYWIDRFHRVRWYNCGRYPAYSIAARTGKLHSRNLTYPLLFGGGARYANGEDSLFLSDCLKAGLRIYAVPEEIGTEIPRPSTWFHGYDEKFFHDRGVLYSVLYGGLAPVMGLRFLHRNRKRMCSGRIGFPQAKKLLFAGIREGRKEL